MIPVASISNPENRIRTGRFGGHPLKLLAMLLAIVVSQTGCGKPDASTGSPPTSPTVTVARPLVLPIVEWDEYIGRLDAIDSVEIRSRVSGYLESTHFDEGQMVGRGDLLAVIDARPFEAKLGAAKAMEREADARLIEARSKLKQAQAERADSRAQLSLADNRYRRARSLQESRAMSREELDVRESEQLQARAAVEAANAQIESANAGIATAQASIATAKANVRAAQLEVDYTRIRAPISGRISRRYVTNGNLIEGGNSLSTLLTTIVSTNPIHCYFDADEQAFLKYNRLSREGKRESSRDVKNPVFMRLVDEEGFPHQGHMDFVDNRIDPNTGTMRGRAIFPNDESMLTPGLFADVRLPGSGRYDAVLIPDSAIGSDQNEKFVYLVVAGEEQSQVVERRSIDPGPIAKGLRVVRSGLDGSERVVTRGLQRIFPGAAVEASEETISPSADDSLPDNYTPVPPEQWLSRKASETTAENASK